MSTRLSHLTYSLSTPPTPRCPTGPWQGCLWAHLLTGNAAMGLLDVVEPQGRQVEHLTSLHSAAKGLGLTVSGVPGQIWCQGVQWDPGHLGTQWMPGNRPPGPLALAFPKVNPTGHTPLSP